MPLTVLIASPEHLQTLRTHEELATAQAFPDAEALRALDVITRQRPEIVALERVFAASSRGAALINRIKADPSLKACEIRLVTVDGEYSRSVARRPTETAGAADAAVDAAVAVETPTVVAPLDSEGTRRAPRFTIVDGVEIGIDGNIAALVDISLVGAMVVSATILRPNQRVRVSLPDPSGPIRLGGVVAWANYEMPKVGPRYRAGIDFFDADVDAIARFIEMNKS